MSLIEEALRQAQQSGSPEAKPLKPAPQPAGPSVVPPTPPVAAGSQHDVLSSFAATWAGVGVLVVGLVAGALWTYRLMMEKTQGELSLLTSHATQAQPAGMMKTAALAPGSSGASTATQPPQAPADSSKSTLAPAASQTTASHEASAKTPPPEFALNGLVEGVGEPFAIINGQIVRLGESISGATLLEVKHDSARLKRSDEELVLRTSR